MDQLLVLATDPSAWLALVTLVVMEVVLGVDNLVYFCHPLVSRSGEAFALTRVLIDLAILSGSRAQDGDPRVLVRTPA
jgi:hypothetical protein